MSTVSDIPVEQICQGTRRRPVDQGSVADIAKSIERDGLYQAIGVTSCTCEKQDEPHYRLVFGAHRLAACARLQRESISAKVLEEGLREEAYLLIELQENSARNDLTGVQRKAYAAEVGRLLQKLSDNSNNQNLNDEWFKEIIKTVGVTSMTLYNWWNTFCQETGLSLTPKQALVPEQQQFFDWLTLQNQKAEAEKERKAAEAKEAHRQRELSEARTYLYDLMQEYGAMVVFEEVINPLFPSASL